MPGCARVCNLSVLCGCCRLAVLRGIRMKALWLTSKLPEYKHVADSLIKAFAALRRDRGQLRAQGTAGASAWRVYCRYWHPMMRSLQAEAQ